MGLAIPDNFQFFSGGHLHSYMLSLHLRHEQLELYTTLMAPSSSIRLDSFILDRTILPQYWPPNVPSYR